MVRRTLVWLAAGYGAGAVAGLATWRGLAAEGPSIAASAAVERLMSWPWIVRSLVALLCVSTIGLPRLPRPGVRAVLALAAGLLVGTTAMLRHAVTRWTLPAYVPGQKVTLTGTALESAAPGWGLRRVPLRVAEFRTSPGARPTDRTVLAHMGTPSGLVVGDGVRVTGYLQPIAPAAGPGEFDVEAYYRLRYDIRLELVGCDELLRLRSQRVETPAVTARVRAWLRHRLVRTMPRASPSLTTDLMLSAVAGLQSVQLPRSIEDDFRRAGTIHILVVSGTQVAVLAGVVLALTRGPGPWRWVGACACVPLIAAYTLLVGPEASVSRAALMGVLAATALALRRDYDAMTALATAALIIMAADPCSVFRPGFQLSVAASVALVWLGMGRDEVLRPGHLPLRPRRRAGGPWQWVLCGLRVSSVVWLAVTPLLLLHFRQASLTSVVSNLVVVPLAGALTILGMASAVLVAPLPGLSYVLNYANSILVEGIVRTTAVFANLPWGVWQCGGPFGWGHVALWYVAVVVGHELVHNDRCRRLLDTSEGRQLAARASPPVPMGSG
ncbi:MAG TPA: ComEC/Rec2 family competence protein [Armatimonadota bacterium]|nr:ComEC/Rec2 family competence protein [Armatimonadota bacterium]